MAKGVLIAALDFSNAAEDEFNDWYDLEHLPERQRVPGFLVCQRWIGVENAKHSVATYDLDSLAVLKSPPTRRSAARICPRGRSVSPRNASVCCALKAIRSCQETKPRRTTPAGYCSSG
jgi:hypothetical protein